MRKPVRKIGAEPFSWHDDEDGAAIEAFMLVLCEAVPGIVMEILKLGFGDLRHWFNNQEDRTWRNAKCGCLVGTLAVVGRDTVQGCVALMDTHMGDDEPEEAQGAIDVLYMAIAAATKRQIHAHGLNHHADPLWQQIEYVGYRVGNECTDAPRTQEVGKYLLDFMRAVLTDMGFKHLPKSPDIPCKLTASLLYRDQCFTSNLPKEWYDDDEA